MVGFDQLLDLLNANFGFLLVVLVDDFNGQSAELASEVVEAKLEGVAHVVADEGAGTTERIDEADFDRLFLGRGLPHRERERDRDCSNKSCPGHPCILFLAARIRCGSIPGDCRG